MIPYFDVSIHSGTGKTVAWQSFLRYEAIPEHFVFWDESIQELFEKWFTVHIDAETLWNRFPLSFSIDFYHYKQADLVRGVIGDKIIDISNNLLNGSISTYIPIIRNWNIDVLYRHTFEHNLYSDGVSDRVKIGLTVTEKLFKNNLLARMRLWGDAYLNHHQNLGYEGFHYGQYVTDNTDSALPDYWVFNFELSATISKMTIMWKVNNILQTAESITNQIFPNLNENYLLITNSNNFPPMNRFITFNVIWNFEN